MKLLKEVIIVEYKNLIEYLPPFLSKYKEYQEIMRVVQMEIDGIRQSTQSNYNNQFIILLDEEGCKRYEKMFNILVTDNATLLDRRFSILTKIQSEIPYTELNLIRKLDLLCGKDNYILNIDAENYEISILIELISKRQQRAVKELFSREVPANMIINVGLRFNQNYKLSKYTHLQLSEKTHGEIRTEVSI